MKIIKYILVNENNSEDAVLTIRNSLVSDFRHSHIISAASSKFKLQGSKERQALLDELCRIRRHWPEAPILGLSEIGLGTRNMERGTRGVIRPSEAMNQIRRELSDLP